jgi:hypothetical protein
VALTDLGFTEKGYLLIPLELEAWGLDGCAVRYDGKTFDAKHEVHITVVNRELGQELVRLNDERPSIEGQIKRALEDAGWLTGKCAYPPGRLYHIATEEKDEHGAALEESIIQRVEVPGIDAFFGTLSAIVGRPLEIPPTHVTLYVLGNPRGISLPDRRTFYDLKQDEVSLAELVRVHRVRDVDRQKRGLSPPVVIGAVAMYAALGVVLFGWLVGWFSPALNHARTAKGQADAERVSTRSRGGA